MSAFAVSILFSACFFGPLVLASVVILFSLWLIGLNGDSLGLVTQFFCLLAPMLSAYLALLFCEKLIFKGASSEICKLLAGVAAFAWILNTSSWQAALLRPVSFDPTLILSLINTIFTVAALISAVLVALIAVFELPFCWVFAASRRASAINVDSFRVLLFAAACSVLLQFGIGLFREEFSPFVDLGL